MQSRPLRILLLALASGVIAMLLALRWVNSNQPESVPVVVLAKNLESGAVIDKSAIELVEWPKKNLPSGVVTDVQTVVGRTSAVDLVKGEPLLQARVVADGAKTKLSMIVAPGKRAMTVGVNDVVGVAGFALPGTYVDVLVNTRNEGTGNQAISKIVMEHLLVLAAAQEVDRNATKPQVTNVVTLEVTPEQAEALDLARSVGTLSLVLRNQNEKDTVTTTGMTKDKLLGIESKPAELPKVVAVAPAPVPRVAVVAPPVAAAQAPKPSLKSGTSCVDIIRGFQKVTECF